MAEPLVVLAEPPKTSLLGLLLFNLLTHRLKNPIAQRRVHKLRGEIQIHAGQMTITLRCSSNRGEGSDPSIALEILQGESSSPRAKIRGTLHAFLGMVRGKGFLLPFLRGDLKASGNLLLLLRLKMLLS